MDAGRLPDHRQRLPPVWAPSDPQRFAWHASRAGIAAHARNTSQGKETTVPDPSSPACPVSPAAPAASPWRSAAVWMSGVLIAYILFSAARAAANPAAFAGFFGPPLALYALIAVVMPLGDAALVAGTGGAPATVVRHLLTAGFLVLTWHMLRRWTHATATVCDRPTRSQGGAGKAGWIVPVR